MKKTKTQPFTNQSLRTQVERLLSQKPKGKKKPFVDHLDELVHELQVHQIELEMQNEELRKAQRKIEKYRRKYYDLYDSAPVGYFTFDPKGRILGCNLAGAELWGMDRKLLPRQPFMGFVSPEYRDTFHLHSTSTATTQSTKWKP